MARRTQRRTGNRKKTAVQHIVHHGKFGVYLALKIFFAFLCFFILIGLLYPFLLWTNLSQINLSSILVLAVCLGIATTLYLFLILKVLHLLKLEK